MTTTTTEASAIRAHDDHVIAQIIRSASQTEAGIHLPESNRRISAVVVDVGHGVERVNIGDKIQYKPAAATIGDAIIAQDTAVFVDEPNSLIAVHKNQIIVRQVEEEMLAHDGYVLAVMLKNEKESPLVVPDHMKRKRGWAKVVHVGYGVERVNVGDEIVYKDTAVFVGGAVVMKENAIVVDEKRGLISVMVRQIIAKRSA